MEDVPSDKVTAIDCGHFFCNNCENPIRWMEHFKVQINEGKSGRIRCMTHKCNTICDEAIIRNLVQARDCEIAQRFDRFLLESYIEDNKRIKWCPGVPHCGNAIRVEDYVCCEVECSCGQQFCFSCLSNAHSPCSCLMWELWSKKSAEESKSIIWTIDNTKPCPKCKKHVQKNTGCNWMHHVCGQAFCWLCAQSTGKHRTINGTDRHSCGHYRDEKKMKVELSERYALRYMHYYIRYKAHQNSLKLERECQATTWEEMSKLKYSQTTVTELGSAIVQELARLVKSRRVLSCSYPFAFYMFGEELFKNKMTDAERKLKQILFEVQQQQFEVNVEKLSKLVEKLIISYYKENVFLNEQNEIEFLEFNPELEAPNWKYSEEKFTDIKKQIIHLSAVTDKLCQNMYEYIEDELLGPLQLNNHNITPYRSGGFQKAIYNSQVLMSNKQLQQYVEF